MAKKKTKRKTEKPPAIDKLLKPAVGVVFAFLWYYFMKGMKTDIARIDVSDELMLREVFFGEGQGKNYVVLCNTLPPEDSSIKPQKISSVFEDAMDELSSSNIGTFVLMDCNTNLPSGKTVAERFNLDLEKRPTIFVSGKIGAPIQITQKHLKTGHMLVKLLKSILVPHAIKIESTKELKEKCLNRDTCALLLKGGTPPKYLKDAVKNLLSMYPNVNIASLDSTTMLVMNLEEHLPEFKAGDNRFVVFKKISGGLDAGDKEGKVADGRLITSILPLNENEVLSFNSMSNLIGDVVSNRKKPKRLSSLPQVKTRTKKLEEQQRQKRERLMNRTSNTPKTQQKTSGAFGGSENDGSKEGRKAERERRRAEHQKNNPNYREKTMEEEAEMERQRRQRMQEEAEKWNIGAEDAPPEGEFVGEDEYESYIEDEDNDYQEMDDSDEEVLDLD